VVWALNRAASRRPRELRSLTEAVDRLRRAQLGRGDLKDATAAYRDSFEVVLAAARGILQEAGTAASPAVERRMRSTLLAAVTDRGLRAALAAGGLVAEQDEPGFTVLSRGPVPAEFLRERTERAAPAPTRAAPRRPGRADRAAARRRDRERRRATKAAEAAERAVQRAERAAKAVEREIEALRARLDSRERARAELRAAADQAKAAAEQARRRSDALAEPSA
jgi:hypothetical protein